MRNIFIKDTLKSRKKSLSSLSQKLLGLSHDVGVNTDTQEIIEKQISHIQENFLFVIVGEVNAGKSSFVNSLLGEEVCATGSEIVTMEVQKIVYGKTETLEQEDNERVFRRTYPAEILKEITIVDTPGTNSREADHQVITEKFIPHCNMVVLVFQMDNIHVQSAWDFFRIIKGKWAKKVIFVLTKADRYEPEEIRSYTQNLSKYARNEGVMDPKIFVTSARNEQKGDSENSGFSEIRSYINSHVLGNAAEDKLNDDIQTLRVLSEDVDEEFGFRKQRYEADKATREDIARVIKSKEELAFKNIDKLVERSLEVYDKESAKTIHTLDEGVGFFSLTFKSIRSVFGGETAKNWLEKVKNDHGERMNKKVNEVLHDGIDQVKSDIQYMVIGVRDSLDALKEFDKSPREMFGLIDAKRNEIIQTLKYKLKEFIENSPVFRGEDLIEEQVDYSGVNMAGGIAAAGTALALITQASVFDITGGIATTLGLLVAGGLAITRKEKFMRKTKDALSVSRTQLSEDLKKNLKGYISEIETHINHQFSEFDHHLASESNQIEAYDASMEAILYDLKKMANEG